MKRFFIRIQLVFVSIILFATLVMVMSLVVKNNYRWDATSEKIYSLSESTVKLLKNLQSAPVDILAFYPHDDQARMAFEVFLKQCQFHHPHFRYHFYDPDRVPSLAKKYNVKKFYTVVLMYQGRSETIAEPTEESFTNALLRLANPKRFNLCFVTSHGESSLEDKDKTGLAALKETVESMNYGTHEVILLRDAVPDVCNVMIVAGPHQDFDATEFRYIKKAFISGRGILFLIDPMDPGAGKSFRDFMASFGVLMSEDVIVDKMSRMVGGDFLVPLVNQYMVDHPITATFEKPTFFPVARSLQPSGESSKTLDVVPLALTSDRSWSETNLQTLEKGEASFEPTTGDLQGPLPVAVAVQGTIAPEETQDKNTPSPSPSPAASAPPEKKGRLVVIGDSDFVTNSYIGLSGNMDFALNAIQWLTQDDRFISIHPRQPEFKPLLLSQEQKTLLLLICIAGLPVAALIFGGLRIYFYRKAG